MRSFKVCSFVLVLFCLSFSGCQFNSKKVYHVGVLCGTESFMGIADGFKHKMTELGYVENENVFYDLHVSAMDPENERRVLEKFVSDNVDLILAFPTEPALQAKHIVGKTGIPVVFAMAGIETSDLVDSIPEPGGNITGVRFPNPETTEKRFEMILSFVPDAKRIYCLYETAYPNNFPAIAALRSLAEANGIELVEDAVKDVEEARAAIKKRENAGDADFDAFYTLPDIINNCPEGFELICDFAQRHGIPIAGGVIYTVEQGAIFGCAPDNLEQGILAAISADKIFNGIPAGIIPVSTPELKLWLNFSAIEKLGLKVSEDLLYRADKIIR
jgi:putative ABC transport system substrate-binding protein